MYKLLVSKKVIKFIKSLPTKQQKIVNHKFELLKVDPFQHQELDIKKMKSKSLLYRLRIGKFRFIYEVNNEEAIIFVYTGGSRGDIYKKI